MRSVRVLPLHVEARGLRAGSADGGGEVRAFARGCHDGFGRGLLLHHIRHRVERAQEEQELL